MRIRQNLPQPEFFKDFDVFASRKLAIYWVFSWFLDLAKALGVRQRGLEEDFGGQTDRWGKFVRSESDKISAIFRLLRFPLFENGKLSEVFSWFQTRPKVFWRSSGGRSLISNPESSRILIRQGKILGRLWEVFRAKRNAILPLNWEIRHFSNSNQSFVFQVFRDKLDVVGNELGDWSWRRWPKVCVFVRHVVRLDPDDWPFYSGIKKDFFDVTPKKCSISRFPWIKKVCEFLQSGVERILVFSNSLWKKTWYLRTKRNSIDRNRRSSSNRW